MGAKVEIESGRLRQRVSLQAPTVAPNAYREKETAWSEVSQAWASVEPLSGRELLQAQQVQADVSHLVTIRWRPGIDASWSVVHRGRRLNIVAALNVEEKNRKLLLYCKEDAV